MAFDRAENGDGTYSFTISLLDFLARPSEFDVRELKATMNALQDENKAIRVEMQAMRENLTNTRSILIIMSTVYPILTGIIMFSINALGA